MVNVSNLQKQKKNGRISFLKTFKFFQLSSLSFPPTIVIRHRRENLKKCTLRFLTKRPDFSFFSYPLKRIPNLENYVLLSLDASEELSIDDHPKGLLILDGTWRYAQVMERTIFFPLSVKRRCLPSYLQTAYPRRQPDCPEPSAGLASIEALAAAYAILGRGFLELLDQYYWREEFLHKNQLNLCPP